MSVQDLSDLHPSKAVARRMYELEGELRRVRMLRRRDIKGVGAADRWGLQLTTTPSQEDGWFIVYLDVMTLLLVAMIVMLAFSGSLQRLTELPALTAAIARSDAANDLATITPDPSQANLTRVTPNLSSSSSGNDEDRQQPHDEEATTSSSSEPDNQISVAAKAAFPWENQSRATASLYPGFTAVDLMASFVGPPKPQQLAGGADASTPSAGMHATLPRPSIASADRAPPTEEVSSGSANASSPQVAISVSSTGTTTQSADAWSPLSARTAPPSKNTAEPPSETEFASGVPHEPEHEDPPPFPVTTRLAAAGSAAVASNSAPVPSVGETLAAGMELTDLGKEIEVLVRERSVNFRINSEILFDSSQAKLSEEGLAVLRRIASVLRRSDHAVTVEGHTDAVPVGRNAPYPSNWELSSARAGSVVRYLQANGVSRSRLRAVGYADTRAIADNNTPQGRARNRRVELVIEPRGAE